MRKEIALHGVARTLPNNVGRGDGYVGMTHLGVLVEVEFLWRNFLILHEFVDARLPSVGSMEHAAKESFLFFLRLYVFG